VARRRGGAWGVLGGEEGRGEGGGGAGSRARFVWGARSGAVIGGRYVMDPRSAR